MIAYVTDRPSCMTYKPLAEVWHIAHFWMSYDRCDMYGSPMGYLVGLSS